MIDCNLLLETLSQKTGVTYLSDLHDLSNRQAILQAVRQVPSGRYSLQAWNDAASYITGEECNFDDEAPARKFLIEYCQK